MRALDFQQPECVVGSLLEARQHVGGERPQDSGSDAGTLQAQRALHRVAERALHHLADGVAHVDGLLAQRLRLLPDGGVEGDGVSAVGFHTRLGELRDELVGVVVDAAHQLAPVRQAELADDAQELTLCRVFKLVGPALRPCVGAALQLVAALLAHRVEVHRDGRKPLRRRRLPGVREHPDGRPGGFACNGLPHLARERLGLEPVGDGLPVLRQPHSVEASAPLVVHELPELIVARQRARRVDMAAHEVIRRGMRQPLRGVVEVAVTTERQRREPERAKRQRERVNAPAELLVEVGERVGVAEHEVEVLPRRALGEHGARQRPCDAAVHGLL